MKKLSIFISITVVISGITLSMLWAERSVKVYSVESDGSLRLKSEIFDPSRINRKATQSDSASSQTSPAKQQVEVGDVMLIDDFEDGDLKNLLGGESGSWNLATSLPRSP